MWWILASASLAIQVGPLPGVLIERRLSEDLVAEIGDTVWVRPLDESSGTRPFAVEGIFERAADPSRISRNDYEVRFHLPDLERMQSNRDRVDRFAIALKPGVEPREAAAWIEGLAFGTQVLETDRVAEESSTTFLVVSRFQDAIGLITLFATGIFLLCLMVIRVDERRADVRTMRLVGISGRTILSTVLLESLVVATLASVAGVLLGTLLTRLVNWYYAAYYDTALRFAIVTPRIALLAVVLGLTLGMVAGAVAAARLVGISPQRLGER
jgi:putative ABC transport system permease protein